jgi:SdrD B-like domain
VPIGAGARIGAGGGSIEGVVYLDDNANGRLDAAEQRAANVSVTLDGRYTTRTDAQGRFEFPFVAPGAHRIAVAADTLPLPWLMAGTEPLRVEVAPRESTRLEIGATREGSLPSGGAGAKSP